MAKESSSDSFWLSLVVCGGIFWYACLYNPNAEFAPSEAAVERVVTECQIKWTEERDQSTRMLLLAHTAAAAEEMRDRVREAEAARDRCDGWWSRRRINRDLTAAAMAEHQAEIDRQHEAAAERAAEYRESRARKDASRDQPTAR
jgi:hypothetical protein